MDIKTLSDRELSERNYYANLMIYERIRSLETSVHYLNNPQFGGVRMHVPIRIDIEEAFNAKLDEFIDSKKKSTD